MEESATHTVLVLRVIMDLGLDGQIENAAT